MSAARRPLLGTRQLFNISFGFFGIQAAFGLQNANVSRIFQMLGASIDALPILWIAGPVTGLVLQPIIGHFSDRTWGPLGRRRPYFLAGAVSCAIAMLFMPNAPALWVAACLLWMLDASCNIAMEPFRAFVGDMLDSSQRTAGYAYQTIFIGAGSVLASLAPAVLAHVFGVANVAPAGTIPPSVRYAFYLGAGSVLVAVMWTIMSTREYSPAQLRTFGETPPLPAEAGPPASARWAPAWIGAGLLAIMLVAWFGADRQLYLLGVMLVLFGGAQLYNGWRSARGARDRLLEHVFADLERMPGLMRRLAAIQALSWFGLFVMFIYATPIVARQEFGAIDPSGQAYADGADWWGVMAAAYNGVAALYGFLIPRLGRAIGVTRLHALNLAAGAAGFMGLALIRDPQAGLLAMVGVGMAWASILTIPYALLCDALPQHKLGIYMGLFNFFIVLPQLVVSTVMGSLGHAFYPQAPQCSFAIGSACFLAAAALTLALERRHSPSSRLTALAETDRSV